MLKIKEKNCYSYIFTCSSCGWIKSFENLTNDGKKRYERIHKKICKGESKYAEQKIKEGLRDIENIFIHKKQKK